jgi:hypothetical protein
VAAGVAMYVTAPAAEELGLFAKPKNYTNIFGWVIYENRRFLNHDICGGVLIYYLFALLQNFIKILFTAFP